VTRVVISVAVLAAAALFLAAGGSARSTQATKLVGTVGPEFSISLVDAQGNDVSKLDPGTYVIQVKDLSDFHNFHLFGTGVNETTGIAAIGDVTWTVTFTDGIYRFVCDAHPTSMIGRFTVGNPPSTSPPPPTPTPTPTPTPKKLVLTSGPGYTITLKTTAGKPAKSLELGTYKVVVRDRSSFHDAHIVAPGFDRSTAVAFVGTKTWKMKLARTGTLRFLCDPHASQGMRGSARIVR
jgi:plastocyanin